MQAAQPNYDTDPRLPQPTGTPVFVGDDVWAELAAAASRTDRAVVVVDCYPGVDEEAVHRALEGVFEHVINVPDQAAKPIDDIDALIASNLGDDRVFGFMTHHNLADLYDAERLEALRHRVAEREGPVVLVGWGAALAAPEPDLMVLADMPRWEIQLRMRAGLPNWRSANHDEDILRKYKRGFFVEWRMADRHKKQLYDSLDYLLDTTTDEPKLITGDTFRSALDQAVTRPFRVVPYFDPGVWGGHWMQEVLGLDGDVPNYAWAFDCVPEENSLALDIDGVRVEMPSMNLVLRKPIELLGPGTFARFGADFPIRFDFLDTMGGGNLSLQVHPLTGYIQEKFGMKYTQDESYYLLDVGEDGGVYLGRKPGADFDEMFDALERAQRGESTFPDEKFVNRFPSKKHDHVLIPAGTIHCSTRNTMVLEISATSYIFTFKMWDWDRVGLDGRPRPVHLHHARPNVQWDRDKEWVERNLINRIELLDEGDGYRIERTGLHELEFINTVRHWFSVPTLRDTRSTVHVINLVEGRAAIVESPTGAFEPYEVHYAETFIVPAAVGEYTIRPADGVGECATLTAFVRGTDFPRSVTGEDLRFTGRTD
ncbi:class I mannose-6-phosphate isomerase [Tessaracoccus flavus]|uniref:Mannose-6-phosphate isomerase n=1 Tax=Tessaracoccus flavus TaxID=1610493 RepID=A0A1Q2CGY1_9ACTN|nr:class I mannose-6-phosphate isomerase [Tessaracoccus flavus]AQP45379.1 mannose-6-phosphate isomerase [Tessaracoccus flavus]SDY93663.1 Mannose-6-phosphate isomerase, class I [Tessaracoccus flavus]